MTSQPPVEHLANVVIEPSVSIAEAMVRLDAAGTGALALCTTGEVLAGLLTDGDIRRAILHGIPLTQPCDTIACRTPIVSVGPLAGHDALRLMNRHDVNHLPVVDANGVLTDLLLRSRLVSEAEVGTGGARHLDGLVVPPSTPIGEAMARLDEAGTGALLLSRRGRLDGLLTDGDVRRAILRRVPMDSPCATIASLKPLSARAGVPPAEALRVMNEHDVHHLPLIDEDGNVAGLLLRKDLVKEECLDLRAVIMAGGFGRRLLPLTEQVPKPMLPVGDRPLLELTIQQLRRSGIRDISLTTHYLPDSIVRHFGDGAAYGVRLRYVQEESPLGTAGGLRLLGKQTEPLLVINGDILTGVPFEEMLAYHRHYGADATVGVRRYGVQVPFGVVECEDVRLIGLQEKPSVEFFVNAGIYILEPSVCEAIPERGKYDMTDLIQALLSAGRRVTSFPIVEYWLDVGRHEDYQQAQEDARHGRICRGVSLS